VGVAAALVLLGVCLTFVGVCSTFVGVCLTFADERGDAAGAELAGASVACAPAVSVTDAEEALGWTAPEGLEPVAEEDEDPLGLLWTWASFASAACRPACGPPPSRPRARPRPCRRGSP